MAEATEARKNPRKVREGTVLSASMDKTAVVSVVDRVRHPLYRKTLQRTKKLYGTTSRTTSTSVTGYGCRRHVCCRSSSGGAWSKCWSERVDPARNTSPGRG